MENTISGVFSVQDNDRQLLFFLQLIQPHALTWTICLFVDAVQSNVRLGRIALLALLIHDNDENDQDRKDYPARNDGVYHRRG